MNTKATEARVVTREEIDLDAMLDEATVAMQRVNAMGRDTRALSQEERVAALAALSKALGLNPLTQPVRFLSMQGGEVLYVTRQATDQIAARLRLNRRTLVGPEVRDFGGTKMVFCQVEVRSPDGRSEVATATLPLRDPCNDLMKCETKAKRRATLSLAGLGLLSEEETETIPGAHRAEVQPAAITPESFAALGVEQPRRVLDAPAEPVDVVADLRAQASRAESLSALAGLWIAAKADVAALDDRDAQERVWRQFKERARELGATVKALQAEIARQSTPPPTPDGTDGPGGPRNAANDTVTGDGTAGDAAPADGASASIAHPEAWRLSRAGITEHVAGINNIPRLANSARRNLPLIAAQLRTHAVHEYAGRLQALSEHGEDGSRLAWEACVERAEGWLREGPRVQVAKPARRAA